MAKRKATTSTASTRRSARSAAKQEEDEEKTIVEQQAAPPQPAPAKRRKKDRDARRLPALKKAATTPTDDDAHSGPNYWLLKAEPETRIEKGKDVKFGIDDLASCREPQPWDGVRNYAARNHLRSMKRGDLGFFYHSNCKEPGVVGILEIVGEAEVDETAFDPKEPYYDPKSKREDPKWVAVKVEFREKFKRLVGLQELKRLKDEGKGGLQEMPLLKIGRLSVSFVPKECWDFIVALGGQKQQS